MAIRDIIQDGNPLLRKISREVTCFDEKLCKLLDDLKQTMQKAEGVGLAAPQVGLLRRAVVVNPKIVSEEGQQVGAEGCLSVATRKQCNVKRPFKVTVEYCDRNGKPQVLKAEGFVARACCHEIDHLNGILFIDRKQDPAKKA
ncbi:MAG: peptide deformylase [Clostridia bacterium]